MAELTTLGQRYAETRLGDVRSRWDGTGVWAAATEDMNLADAMRRCLRIGADDMEGARGGDARSSPGSLVHASARTGSPSSTPAEWSPASSRKRRRDLGATASCSTRPCSAAGKSLGLGAQGGARGEA